MTKDYMLNDNGSFIIKNYNQTNPFSNFLPGIAGVWGVPMWVFYVNRAQGIVSFGIKDKDHSITEFFPANKAYTFTPVIGFRTFLKINNKVHYEPFRVTSHLDRQEQMNIRSASFEITKTNRHLGLEFSVKYFTLPNCPVGGLVRVLSIKNSSSAPVDLEILDGLARIIPFGSSNLFLTDLTRTLEAWMRSAVEKNLAIFRLIVDPKDASQTKYVDGANFNFSFYEQGNKHISPYLIVDPEVIFGHDTSFTQPVKFYKQGFATPIAQITCGKTPCSFSHFTWSLEPGEAKTFYSIFGATFKLELIKKFVPHVTKTFLEQKEKENEKLVEDIKNYATCVAHSKEFNQYVKATYLDNVLRGGFPYYASEKKDDSTDGKGVYYIFSRKHGDLERDYNKFKLLPSYFSEGEANYRDINQNRRIDLFFNPHIGRKNIVYFFNFIKIDGYNPLIVKGEKLFFSHKQAEEILNRFKIHSKKLLSVMVEGFYLGDFFKILKEEGITPAAKETVAHVLVEHARKEPIASHGEGYWIDHWFYNLDLIETFLRFYPDKLKELFLTKEYFFWDEEYRVKERSKRYFLKDGVVHQWHSVEEVMSKKESIAQRGRFANFLRDKKGVIYKTDLIEKLLTLILNKVTTLDPDGIGIEMEADKPGWCDALNGLPSLLGSSTCEAFELKRMCDLLQKTLLSLKCQNVATVTLCSDVAQFLKRVCAILDQYERADTSNRDYAWWEKANAVKEDFRRKTFLMVDSAQKKIMTDELVAFCRRVSSKLENSLTRAVDKKSGVTNTYFTYSVSKFSQKKQGVVPLQFSRRALPLFLEGPVHELRVSRDKKIYQAVRSSHLYDTALGMYRLNATLQNEPLEIGRGRIFVPGWLENESVWLHMEYKFLYEVLRCGLYEEFYKDFHKCCVCFFEPSAYGRNILENSSFIVSSAHPDKSLWGKGFVARLSGATVELLDIVTYLSMGEKPFTLDDKGVLCVRFQPILRSDMFTKKQHDVEIMGRQVSVKPDSFAFLLFSKVLVTYHNPRRKNTYDKGCTVKSICVTHRGAVTSFAADTITAPLSYAIRDAQVERIDIELE